MALVPHRRATDQLAHMTRRRQAGLAQERHFGYMRAATVADSVGGIINLASLRASGIGKQARASAVRSGELIRLRNGWFARPDADPHRSAAVRIGGRITCVSRLSELGLWTMPDSRLHVSVRGDATRLRSAADRRVAFSQSPHPDVALHWPDYPWDAPTSAIADSLESSIAHLLGCVDRESAIVTIDSALNTKFRGEPMLTVETLRAILEVLPSKHSPVIHMVDAGAQSGLETLCRLRLRKLGIQVRTQVKIVGVGFVDVLVGERLVIELDSRAHHLGDNYERDRARDLELFRQGFAVIRVSYHRVMYDWPSVEAAILAAVRRGEHLRRAMHRRHGLALT